VGGTRLRVGEVTVSGKQGSLKGKLVGAESAHGDSWFVLDGKLPEDCVGQTLLLDDGDVRRAYPIRAMETADGRSHVYTKKGNVGFEARSGETWEFVTTSTGQAG